MSGREKNVRIPAVMISQSSAQRLQQCMQQHKTQWQSAQATAQAAAQAQHMQRTRAAEQEAATRQLLQQLSPTAAADYASRLAAQADAAAPPPPPAPRITSELIVAELLQFETDATVRPTPNPSPASHVAATTATDSALASSATTPAATAKRRKKKRFATPKIVGTANRFAYTALGNWTLEVEARDGNFLLRLPN
jgi:hypothetical protein